MWQPASSRFPQSLLCLVTLLCLLAAIIIDDNFVQYGRYIFHLVALWLAYDVLLAAAAPNRMIVGSFVYYLLYAKLWGSASNPIYHRIQTSSGRSGTIGFRMGFWFFVRNQPHKSKDLVRFDNIEPGPHMNICGIFPAAAGYHVQPRIVSTIW